MADKLKLKDLEITPEIARAVIAEAKSRDVYDEKAPTPEDDAGAVKLGEELVQLSLDEWYTSSPAELKGEIGEDVKALLGLANIVVDGEGNLSVAGEGYTDEEAAEDQADHEERTETEDSPAEPDEDPEEEPTQTPVSDFDLSEHADVVEAAGDEDSDEPWDGYDKNQIPTILKKLKAYAEDGDLDDEAKAYVYGYEKARKDRKAILEYLAPTGDLDPDPAAKPEGKEHEELDDAADEAVAKDDRKEAKASIPEGAKLGDPVDVNGETWYVGHGGQLSQVKPTIPDDSGDDAEERHELAGVPRERFARRVSDENLPVPPQPAFGEDPQMPDDISTLGDDELSQLYLDFNACLARANWLLGLAQVDEVNLERAVKRARARAVLRLKGDKDADTGKPKTVPVLEAEVELDDDVVKLEDAHAEAEAEVKGYTKLASAYQGHVDRLSRVGGWRRDEAERAVQK